MQDDDERTHRTRLHVARNETASSGGQIGDDEPVCAGIGGVLDRPCLAIRQDRIVIPWGGVEMMLTRSHWTWAWTRLTCEQHGDGEPPTSRLVHQLQHHRVIRIVASAICVFYQMIGAT